MTWFRIKKRPKLRRCKISISPKCKIIFKTRAERPIACEPCRKHLIKMGTNAYDYLRLGRK